MLIIKLQCHSSGNGLLNKWLVIFSCASYSGRVGLHLQQCMWTGTEPISVLRDVLGLKSPGTAYKRASTIMAFLDWLDSRYAVIWPPGAEMTRNYLEATVGRDVRANHSLKPSGSASS